MGSTQFFGQKRHLHKKPRSTRAYCAKPLWGYKKITQADVRAGRVEPRVIEGGLIVEPGLRTNTLDDNAAPMPPPDWVHGA